MKMEFACPLDRTPLSKRLGFLICGKRHKFSVNNGVPVFFRKKGEDWEKRLYEYEKILSKIYADRIRRKNGWWEKEASKYQNLKKDYVFVQGREKLLDRVGQKQGVFLDLGCGEGYVIRKYLRKSKRGRMQIMGTDVATSALRRAKRLSNEVVFFSADAAHLPLPDESVDVVTATEVVEHIPNLKELFMELFRVLKKDGVLMLTTPNPNSLAVWIDYHGMEKLLGLLRWLTGKRRSVHKKQEGEDYDVLVDRDKLRKWLGDSGFVVEQEFSEILPESYFALMEDLKVPISAVKQMVKVLQVLEDYFLPNIAKRFLGFTQIAYAKKEDNRGL